MEQKKDGKNEKITINNFVILYKGIPDLKTVRGLKPDEMRVVSFCGITKDGLLGVGVSFFDPDNSEEKGGVFLSPKDYSEKPISDIVLCYRIAKVFEALPLLRDPEGLAMTLHAGSFWADLTVELKMGMCKVLGISLDTFEESMELIPPNLEQTLFAMQQAEVEIFLGTIQQEVAKGNIPFTPFLEKLGIKSPDEFRKEEAQIQEIVNRNIGYVSEFVQKVEMQKLEIGSPFDQRARRYITKAAIRGVQEEEDDLVVGGALLEANDWVLEQMAKDPIGLTSVFELMFPGVKVIPIQDREEEKALKEKIKKADLYFKRSVADFLAKRFSVKGRKSEDYLLFLEKVGEQYQKIAV